MNNNDPFEPPALASPAAPLPAPASAVLPVNPSPSFPSTYPPNSPSPSSASSHSTFNPSAAGYGQVATDRREPNTAAVVVAWIATFVLFGYMLPWAIAATRGKSNQAAIGVVNLLVGWTVIGWIVALVMACQAHQVVGAGTTTIFVSNVAPAHHVAESTAGPAAGWFASPDGNGRQYWDGTRWTGHRAP